MHRVTHPLVFILSAVFCLAVTGTSFAVDAPAAQAKGGSLILATTTSTQATGLLDVLLAKCSEATGISVKAVAVGTGRALELAKNGDADVVMVHARTLEDVFVAEGFGTNAYDLMYNDFLIVGPASDTALAKSAPSAAAAFGRIASGSTKFISRGDRSGTHERELSIWKELGIVPTGFWYVEAGQGMAETLKMADEMQAYVLTDRATWLSMRGKLHLSAIYEKPDELKNPYGIIAVNNAKVPGAKTDLAIVFIDWVIGPQGQDVIKNFKIDGEQLFHLAVGKRK